MVTDGSIWIGAYPECTLTRLDPASGRFTQFGSMDSVDHYISVLCGADGTVAIPAKFFDEAKAAKPYLFAVTGAKTGNTSNTGRTPPPATDGANVLTMTDAEYAVARAAVTARAA